MVGVAVALVGRGTLAVIVNLGVARPVKPTIRCCLNVLLTSVTAHMAVS